MIIVPNIGDTLTNPTTGVVYKVAGVNKTTKMMLLAKTTTPDKFFENPYDGKALGNYIHTPAPKREGGKKSRNKRRKNKRKTMRRNKFMKWF